MKIESRLGQIERQLLRPDRAVRISPPIIAGYCGRQPTPADAERLGPMRMWITYQRQLRSQEEANAEHLRTHPGTVGRPSFIEVSVDGEDEARAIGEANHDDGIRHNPTK